MLTAVANLRAQMANEKVDNNPQEIDISVEESGDVMGGVTSNQDDIDSQLTSNTLGVPTEITTATTNNKSTSPSKSPSTNAKNSSKTSSLTTASTPKSTVPASLNMPTQQLSSSSTSKTNAPAKVTTSTSNTSVFGRPLPSEITSNHKGRFQFNGKPIWFCAAGMQYCMAPHVEVGKLLIHKCKVCRQKLHTFCVSTNNDGVMTCAGCDPLHSYKDAIASAHPIVPKWKLDLLNYFKQRNGIPKNMSFLAGEYHLQNEASGKKTGGRQSRNSSKRPVLPINTKTRSSRRRVSNKR